LTMSDSREFLDPYLDPKTGILRNLIGARTKDALDGAEGSLSFARLVQLMDHPPRPTGDLISPLCSGFTVHYRRTGWLQR
jgi:hypothetical protein